MQLLLDNALGIIFFLTVGLMTFNYVKKFKSENKMTSEDLKEYLQQKLGEIGQDLLFRLTVAGILTIFISLVSFKEFFATDVFHVVILTLLLQKKVKAIIRSIFP